MFCHDKCVVSVLPDLDQSPFSFLFFFLYFYIHFSIFSVMIKVLYLYSLIQINFFFLLLCVFFLFIFLYVLLWWKCSICVPWLGSVLLPLVFLPRSELHSLSHYWVSPFSPFSIFSFLLYCSKQFSVCYPYHCCFYSPSFLLPFYFI